MPIFAAGAILGIGGALIGDATSAYGTSQTNDTNAQINQNNINAAWSRQQDQEEFNSAEAQKSRDWSAQQIAGQEQFQQQSMNQAENYDTWTSDTAMQRRVADLKASGINPLLAVSQGGASTPTISPQSGSITSGAQASAGTAGQGSGIPMQNPTAAFGNLGGQLNSALQTETVGANIDLMRAQANKLNVEAGTEIPTQVNYLKSMTGLNDQNATQAYYNTQKIQEQIYGERLSNDQLRDILTPMGQQNLEVVRLCS